MEILCISLPPPAGQLTNTVVGKDILTGADSSLVSSMHIYQVSLGKTYAVLGIVVDAANSIFYLLKSDLADRQYPTSLIALVSDAYFSIKNNDARTDWKYWKYSIGTYRYILCPSTWGEPLNFMNSMHEGSVTALDTFMTSCVDMVSVKT
jgi:hypothetical protein